MKIINAEMDFKSSFPLPKGTNWNWPAHIPWVYFINERSDTKKEKIAVININSFYKPFVNWEVVFDCLKLKYHITAWNSYLWTLYSIVLEFIAIKCKLKISYVKEHGPFFRIIVKHFWSWYNIYVVESR